MRLYFLLAGLTAAMSAPAGAQVTVHVAPWSRSVATQIPLNTSGGWQTECLIAAHNAGPTTQRVQVALNSIDAPFLASPVMIEFTLDPGELEIRPGAIFSSGSLGADETVEHIIVAQPTLVGGAALPVLGLRAHLSSQFVVTPLTPVVDRRGQAGSFTIDLRVDHLAGAANNTRTLSFGAIGSIQTPAPIDVTLPVGASTTISVSIVPTAGAGAAGIEYADLDVLYTDDPAIVGGPFQHASASMIFGPLFDPADINHDGVVNGSDLAILLNNWTNTGP